MFRIVSVLQVFPRDTVFSKHADGRRVFGGSSHGHRIENGAVRFVGEDERGHRPFVVCSVMLEVLPEFRPEQS